MYVRVNKVKVKCWILCITCTWSRAVNLKLCRDLTVGEFLRALQLHFFQYGIAKLCISDLGSQIVKGGNIIADFVRDMHTVNYFRENGIGSLKFEQYYKGKSELGALVEVCVKFVKRLIFGAIRNYIVELRDFEFLVEQTVHLINRRPVAFKEALRDEVDYVPEPITPEKLIHGYDLVSVNIIPELQPDPDMESEWDSPTEGIKSSFEKLRVIRESLYKIYHEEFLANLVNQAIDDNSRYKAVKHEVLHPGDIVLVKELHTKAQNYPMAVVKSVEVNVNGEITGAVLKKGKSNEVIKRHVTNLIPLLTRKLESMLDVQSDSMNGTMSDDRNDTDSEIRGSVSHAADSRCRPVRDAAVKSKVLTRLLLDRENQSD